MSTTRRLLIKAGLLALPASRVFAQSAAYPGTRPVRFVVPYPPGGGTDSVARLIADGVGAEQGWTVVVDNKPGANGNIGLDAVAKGKPDGLTIGLAQTSNLAINPALMPRMPFDPTRDFVPVVLVATLPIVLVVRADAPWRRLSDLVAAAAFRPGMLKQALAGTGTVGHLAGELLCKRAGIQVLNVPYRGATQALTDLIGGQSDFMMASPQAVTEMIRGGRLRVLAVTSTQRMAILPEVPTVAESGYPGFEASDWKAVMAPAGTPAAVVRNLNAAVNAVLAKPATIGKLVLEGSAPLGGTAEAAARFIRSEQAKWAAVVRDANIKIE